MLRRSSVAVLLVGLLCLPLGVGQASAQAGGEQDRLIEALKSGEAFAFMRHALAPGSGDPSTFDVNDCQTQRNLSEEGRQQAREIGAFFKAKGIESAKVYSSAWCRCLDTANLLGLGPVEVFEVLNSFFLRPGREEQTAALRAWLAAYQGGYPLVLVSHQVNISALTGRGVASGETLVVTMKPDGAIEVLGSFGGLY